MVHILNPDSQTALTAEAQRLVDILHDFDPTLELRWIPPETRTVFDTKPFAIIQYSDDHPDGFYFVMHLAEDELDHRILARLFKARNFSLSDLEAEETAMRAMKLKEEMDSLADAHEFGKFVMQSNKRVRHNGRLWD